MRTPGSVLVMLRRPKMTLGEVPQLYPPDGPWALTPRDNPNQTVAIEPTPVMQAMMPGREGLFYAIGVGAGRAILGRADDV
jgi:hypothetical protein